MPRAIDPNATYPYVFESDRDKPAAQQPRFLLRVLSARQWRKASGELESVIADDDKNVDRIAAMGRIIGLSLAGWENVHDAAGAAIPFDLERIEDLLTPAEMTDLALATIRNGELDPDSKKKSESPLSASSASSAEAAAQENASTAPASNSQP